MSGQVKIPIHYDVPNVKHLTGLRSVEMPAIGDLVKARAIGHRGCGTYSWQACPNCGKERWVGSRADGKLYYNRCYICAIKLRKTWKGGRCLDDKGYVRIWLKSGDFFSPMANKQRNIRGGYVLEHRLVMAKHLGRCLHSWETVHHKGIRYIGIENKADNLLDNLKLTTRGSHMREHQKGYKDGYREGYQDAQNAKIKELLEHIKLLEWQLKEPQRSGAE